VREISGVANEGGDLVTLVTKVHGCDFKAAVAWLAELAGVPTEIAGNNVTVFRATPAGRAIGAGRNIGRLPPKRWPKNHWKASTNIRMCPPGT